MLLLCDLPSADVPTESTMPGFCIVLSTPGHLWGNDKNCFKNVLGVELMKLPAACQNDLLFVRDLDVDFALLSGKIKPVFSFCLVGNVFPLFMLNTSL